MSVKIYQKVNETFEFFEKTYQDIETAVSKSAYLNLPKEVGIFMTFDPLICLSEIDALKKKFPDTHQQYFNSLHSRYLRLSKWIKQEIEYLKLKKHYDKINDLNSKEKHKIGADIVLFKLDECVEIIIKHLEKHRNTVDKDEIPKDMEPTKAQKKVEPYDRIAGSLGRLNEIFTKINHDRLNGLPFCEYPEIEEVDQFKICVDIDHFKKKYPDTYSKYLRQLLIEYFTLMSSKDYFISEYLPEFEDEYIDPYGFWKLFTAIDYVVDHLKEILKIENIHELLNPETEFQETPQNLDKLGVIEKLLIIHYLKIESLNRYPYHLKPGVFFLSKLLDINPHSIKRPLLKLTDYVDNDKLTESQARNLYPTLEKVKSFFDESDLNEISKVIEVRINELKRKSGKD